MTPTANASLPLRLGDFPGLVEALDYAARGETGVNFFDGRGNPAGSMGYAALRDAARAAAAHLGQAGLRAGDRIALVAETGPAFLAVFYGCQYAGIVPCILPHRLQPGSGDAPAMELARFFARTGAGLMLAPERMIAIVQAAVGAGRAAALEAFTAPISAPPAAPVPAAADRPAYVQYSSGSTADPRGIPIMLPALMANVAAIASAGLRLRGDDRAFSWLPLYHDMGLVGFSIVAMAAQRSVDYLSPNALALRPGLWLRLMSQQRSNIVYAPSFAWRLAAERASGEQGLDLSALRVAGIGGDMVRRRDMAAFASAFASAGFDPAAFQPSYGLAEAVLAISIAQAGSPPREDAPDDAQGERRFVGCGRPLPGITVRIADDAGKALPDGATGRIRVAGANIMPGYDGAPPLAEGALLETGDLGFLRDGELFVTGRAKDLIAVRGRNIWAQDVEWAAETVPPIRPGDTAAFGVDDGGGETVVLLVQRASADRDALRARIGEALASTLGITATIVFVPPRALPFTSSGKLARARARTLYLTGIWSGAEAAPAVSGTAPACLNP
ncbi:MAG: AMP-binding protein [Sphingomonas sp.]|nr:AMP-binding protein [Sphingomonas sp.]MDX3883858.1 AMP-binding protein [Sphingomonas sp.]